MIKPNQKKEPTTDSLSWAETETGDLSPKEAIKIAFPLNFQQPIVETANWALDYFTDHVGEKMVSQILKNSKTALNFGRFFAVLGLEETDGGRDLCIFVEDLIDDYTNDEIIDLISTDINDLNCQAIDYVNEVSRLLSLTKDEIINELIIPNYKVFKSSHIWLEEQTESALKRAFRKIFAIDEIPLEIWQIENQFDDADHVSIFEYFMEGQDLQTELKIQQEIANKAVVTANPISLYDLLTDEERKEWTSPFLKAFQEVEFSRIVDSEIDDVIDYVVSVFNRVVYNWEMPMKYYKVIVEDLEEWLQEFKILDRFDFFIQGMKAGYSAHCLRQYPSGFPKGEKTFPRAFIHRKDEEGQLKICEAIEFVKGLPTELDRKIGEILLENYKDNEEFVQGTTTLNCYYFDGVNQLARDCNLPYMEDKFGQEIYQIFRDMVSKMSLSELYCLVENFEYHCDEGIKTKSLRGWVAFYDYLSLELLSTKAKVPKKILKHYKRIFNSCANDCWNGNY